MSVVTKKCTDFLNFYAGSYCYLTLRIDIALYIGYIKNLLVFSKKFQPRVAGLQRYLKSPSIIDSFSVPSSDLIILLSKVKLFYEIIHFICLL